ncbi:hypothetical protein TWF506_004067 [Arthrobotrys conoides]|uniref:Uncharacterized protein n=1 Tax=Arthrobotrys conoides TaxID=74498 RepID=A0AAN8NKR2_9PEZI
MVFDSSKSTYIIDEMHYWSILSAGSPGLSLLLLDILHCLAAVNAQSSLTAATETVFETVGNQNTVTSILRDCNKWNGLPGCDKVTWAPRSFSSMVSSSSSSSSSTSTSTTSSIISTPTSGEAFVLRGQGIYKSLYVQFDDSTGRAVLTYLGTSRFVSFILDEENNGLLQNAQYSTELVFGRLNSSANNVAFSGESKMIRNLLREVHHSVGAERNVLRSDYLAKWFWNSTTGGLELSYNGRKSWVFYQAKSSNAYRKRATSFDLYLLPAGITIPEDSAMERVLFVPEDPRRYSSFLSSARPIPTTSATLSESAIPTKVFILSSSTTTSASLSVSSSESSSTPSSNSTLDAYDAITQFSLESYCTEFLSYTPPVATVTSTSQSTSYYAAATGAVVEITSTITVGRRTSVNIIKHRIVMPSPVESPQFKKRGVPDQLTTYSNEFVSSACSKILSSLSSTSTTTEFTDTTVTEATQSTLIATTIYSVAKTTVDVVMETAINIGYAKIITPDNVSSSLYRYFGLYLANYWKHYPSRPGKCGRVEASINNDYLHQWYLGYSTTADSYQLFLNSTCVVGFGGKPPVSGWSKNAPDTGVNSIELSEAHSHVPLYWKFNNMTRIASPDFDKMPEELRGGTFWICVIFPALYDVFFHPALSDLAGYRADVCTDTGMNHLLFTYDLD